MSRRVAFDPSQHNDCTLENHLIPQLYDLPEKKYQYFIDVCAFRREDIKLHQPVVNTFLQDLVIYCQLVIEQGLLPNDWDWTQIIKLYEKDYVLEHDEAFRLYNGTNGLQLLRKSARLVYCNRIPIHSGSYTWSLTAGEQAWSTRWTDPMSFERLGGWPQWSALFD